MIRATAAAVTAAPATPLDLLIADAVLFSRGDASGYSGGQVPLDESPSNHTDGTLGGTSGTDADDPTWNASGWWEFDAANLERIRWPDSADWNIADNTGGHTRVIVARWASAQPSFTRLLESGDGPTYRATIWVSSSTVTWRLDDGPSDVSVAQAATAGSTWQVITARCDGTTQAIRVNGTENTGTRPSGVVETTRDLCVGRNAAATAQGFTGDVRMVGVWPRVLTNTEVALLESTFG